MWVLQVHTCGASLLSLLEETIKIDCLIKSHSPTVSRHATTSHTQMKEHRNVQGEPSLTYKQWKCIRTRQATINSMSLLASYYATGQGKLLLYIQKPHTVKSRKLNSKN